MQKTIDELLDELTNLNYKRVELHERLDRVNRRIARVKTLLHEASKQAQVKYEDDLHARL